MREAIALSAIPIYQQLVRRIYKLSRPPWLRRPWLVDTSGACRPDLDERPVLTRCGLGHRDLGHRGVGSTAGITAPTPRR
jgi:hypothetical protein